MGAWRKLKVTAFIAFCSVDFAFLQVVHEFRNLSLTSVGDPAELFEPQTARPLLGGEDCADCVHSDAANVMGQANLCFGNLVGAALVA